MTRIPVSRPNGSKSGLEEGRGIPCRPNPAATLLVNYTFVAVMLLRPDPLGELTALPQTP